MDDKKKEPKFVETWTRNPDTVKWEQMRQAAKPINMDNYQNIVDYRAHETVEEIKEAMMDDMVKRGATVGPDRPKQPLNLGGINDTRADKGKKFKVGVD